MSLEQRYLRLIAGESPGLMARTARAALAGLSPIYSAAVRARNLLYDRGLKGSVELPRPVVSVGNITTGGTGKTPFVAWLAGALAEAGLRPAVLMRGYKARRGKKGDEQRLLEEMLGPAAPVEADPDRRAAARRVLARDPAVSVFLLDDGFQHRRVRRSADLVLIDATRPFGFGRTLPGGLLREPLVGLARASALIITRAGLAGESEVARIERAVRRHSGAPILRCDFVLDRLTLADGRALDGITGRRVLGVCGIGNPPAFEAALLRRGAEVVRLLAFPDHHFYRPADVRAIEHAAGTGGAELVVTTAKDWTKLDSLWPAAGRDLAVAHQRVEFEGSGAEELMDIVRRALGA